MGILERVAMTPPFAGLRLLACLGGYGTTGGWEPTDVIGLWGGCSYACADSSSKLVDPLSYSYSSLSTLSICHLNVMDLSLTHAPVAWDPRVSVVEAKLLPHKLSCLVSSSNFSSPFHSL
jgi:hypothetical protein